jgi:4-hydroxybenzoate polyprenyltransferase
MFWKPILSGIIFGLLLVVVALSLKSAAAHHIVSGDVPLRAIEMLMGLMIAFYGNAIPKTLQRLREGKVESGRVQSLRRTVGWLLTVGGLGFAAVWAVAPLSEAAGWSVAVIGAAIGLIVVCIVWMHMTSRRPSQLAR